MEAAEKDSKPARQKEEKDRNTGHNPEDCPVCLEAFSDTSRRPRTLPCGHTVCTLCIKELKEYGHVICPECRVSHAVPVGGLFPISYTLEAVIRRLREGPPPPGSGKGKKMTEEVCPKGWVGLSKKMRYFLQEKETTVLAAIKTCQEVQSQLEQYQTTLSGWGKQQQQLEIRLQGVLDHSRSARELAKQEESRAMAKMKEAKKDEQQLQDVLETVRAITSEQETGIVVPKVLRCIGEAEQVEKESREIFPDVDITITIKKVTDECSAAIEAVQEVQTALKSQTTVTTEEILRQLDPELRLQSDQDSTIMSRLHAILAPRKKGPLLSQGPSLAEEPRSLQAEDLYNLTQPVRRLLAAGRVFAFQVVEAQERYARISLENNLLNFHVLKASPLPPWATALQVGQMVPTSPPCTVFLDLSWPGSASMRRVTVHLRRNTPRGRHFLLMCTGQRGASYVNTKLFAVVNKGEPGECVCGGDYESNDGEGGAVLLPHLDQDQYKESGKAGAVCGWWWGGHARGAQFAITTRDCVGSDRHSGVFGKVVQGLDAVVAAAHHRPINEVTVVDCGVALWL